MWKTVIVPRVSETDALGHINNTTIAVWLEAGRTQLFRVFNPENDFLQWRMIVVSLEIDFRHELFFGADVEVRVAVKRVGRSSLELSEEIWQRETLCVSAKTTYVHVDPTTRKSSPIPPAARRILEKHMPPTAEATVN